MSSQRVSYDRSPARLDIPQLSVIIPTFNEADLLERQLEYLATQRDVEFRWEVIVSDDGSKDRTPEVVAAFHDRMPVVYVRQPDRGFRVALARNRGAAAARGGILCFLDTGALPGPFWVAEHYQFHLQANAHSSSIAVGYAMAYDPYHEHPHVAQLLTKFDPLEVVIRAIDNSELLDLRDPEFRRCGYDLSRLRAPWIHCWSLNISLSAVAFWAVDGFNEHYLDWGGEDLDLGYRLMTNGADVRLNMAAWVIEQPVRRSINENSEHNMAKAWRLWQHDPNAITEVYGAMYSVGHWDPPLEAELTALDDWAVRVADRLVDDEVMDALRARGVDRRHRVCVVGAGPRSQLDPVSLGDASLVLADYASAITDRSSPRYRRVDALGVRFAFVDDHFDFVVISSRLSDLRLRWGNTIWTEANRIGIEVIDQAEFSDSPTYRMHGA